MIDGVTIHTSPHVPDGEILLIGDALYFHSRVSVRGRKRRGHGRPRNHPRVWKVRLVRYQPDLDRVFPGTQA